jgi:hypothetical protein
VKATWADDGGLSAEQELNATPTAVNATATEAEVTLSGAAATGEFVTAGETGSSCRW